MSGPLTLEETSWLAGSYPLGALLGDVLFSVLLNYLGRKIPMMVLAIPNLVSERIKKFSMPRNSQYFNFLIDILAGCTLFHILYRISYRSFYWRHHRRRYLGLYAIIRCRNC